MSKNCQFYKKLSILQGTDNIGLYLYYQNSLWQPDRIGKTSPYWDRVIRHHMKKSNKAYGTTTTTATSHSNNNNNNKRRTNTALSLNHVTYPHSTTKPQATPHHNSKHPPTHPHTHSPLSVHLIHQGMIPIPSNRVGNAERHRLRERGRYDQQGT